jgi:excisionase family DNA binding protein
MTIINLATHPEAYVTVRELAEYWQVSRRVIYKQIEAGTLESIRLGPRLLRIRTVVAQEFEQAARMRPDERLAEEDTRGQEAPAVQPRARASGSGR